MARLVIVSNRVMQPGERGARAGGLAVALRDALRHQGGLWFGWSGEIVEQTDAGPVVRQEGRVASATLDLTKQEYDRFYLGFANGVLWPTCHYRLGLIAFRREDLEGYRAVNRRFAQQLAKMLKPDDVIWVHDYHFIPMAEALRQAGVQNRIGFFLHIPFPAREVFAAIPNHAELASQLCAYDLVGFQTPNDARAFSDYLGVEIGAQIDDEGRVDAFGRNLKIGAFPISIDADAIAEEAARPRPETERMRQSLAGRKMIIGVDRLDYSKGLPLRFEAYAQLLANYPEHRSKVVFMQIAPPSRGDIGDYRALRRELDQLTGRINGKFAEFDWVPLRYLNRSFPRTTLASFYRSSAVGLVTPLRDGMNLVAKEYVAAQDGADPGVLVLSRFAGAAQELGTSLIVHPHDVDGIAQALHRALTMSKQDRVARWSAANQRLHDHSIVDWYEDYLGALKA